MGFGSCLRCLYPFLPSEKEKYLVNRAYNHNFIMHNRSKLKRPLKTMPVSKFCN